MDILVVDEISKYYAEHIALDNVSMKIPKQSIFGLLGPNGAGKTSLIRIINMITAPDKGAVTFRGEKLSPMHKSFFGYLPEERGLYKKMKVGEQAVYLARLKGIPGKEATARIKEWLERFELQNWWNRKVEELSKGMQQKVQFITTIIHQPELLIFDEPFSGFDPINAGIIKDEILRLRDNGCTIIFSTHNMASVEELCDNIALINNSKLILEGKVRDIKNTYKTKTWEVVISGMKDDLNKCLSPGCEIVSCKSDGELLKAVVKIQNNNPNLLLQEIIPHGTIQSVNEVLPDMNDIFIACVNNSSNK